MKDILNAYYNFLESSKPLSFLFFHKVQNRHKVVPLCPRVFSFLAHEGSMLHRGSLTIDIAFLLLQVTETKGRNTAQSIPTKKRRDHGEKDQSRNGSNNQDGCADSFSLFSSRAMASEKEKEELIALREQVEDLQRKIAEKDELLKSAEISKSQMSAVHAKLDELKQQVAEKDSLIKSTQLQLSDAKVCYCFCVSVS